MATKKKKAAPPEGAVRAKFVVTRIERMQGTKNELCSDPKNCPAGVAYHDPNGYHVVPAEQRTIVAQPVYSNDPDHENKRFWDASPGGELRLNVVNLEAAEHFELNKEYYLDFTAAPED